MTMSDHNERVPVFGQLTDDEIEAVYDRTDGYICPECGANDWLAEERVGDYIRVRCDDCCRYGALLPMPEAPR
jgi:predicted  nucleic acid-binding Zn ribbon protein